MNGGWGVRIAVTGTHGVGKTTLVEDFVAARRDALLVPEPYWLMAAEGVPFADGPTSADLEIQLERSCALILAEADEPLIIFDRSPIDFLAYLEVISEAEGFEWFPAGKLLTRIEKALARLDLLVFVPLVQPDDIAVTIEYPALRKKVDARLKSIIRKDELGLFAEGPRVLEVSGPRDLRLERLVAKL